MLLLALPSEIRPVIRFLYDRTLRAAEHPRALWTLACVSFAESSFFPVPPDILLIPMVLADRTRAWLIAAVCTLASVAGGIAGYLIGRLLFEEIGETILQMYGYQDKMLQFRELYTEWGFWIVFGGGLTPLPYKLITIASGVFDLSLVVFIVASVVSRGARFFLVAGLLWYFGPPIRAFIEKRLGLVVTVGTCALIGGFVIIRYLV